jgi:hypothetical protein
MADAEHLPDRPSWNCKACGEPWPCPPAQKALSEEFAVFPTVLGLYLAGQYVDAQRDFIERGERSFDLYTRIVSWARQRPAD